MSRIGNTIINLPANVKVNLEGDQVEVQGQKGSLKLKFPSRIKVVEEGKTLKVTQIDAKYKNDQIHGLFRSLLNNAVIGVDSGWEKTVELVGVGYKALGGGNEVTLNIGFTHPVIIKAPADIVFKVSDNTKVTVSGIDKKLVGEIAAKLRAFKPPEPYKGKGVRYLGEVVRKKAGKAVKATGAPS